MKTEQAAKPHMATETKREGAAPRAVTDGETVLATADIAMTPERVFQALNTNIVQTWWGSADTYSMQKWTSDLRVGGLWSVLSCGADGSVHPVSGKFIEVDAPHKTVFTRKYGWNFPVLGDRDTTVTYLLEPIESGTRVTVRHDGFSGLLEPAKMHAEGWQRVLGWLDPYADGSVQQ